MSVQQEKVKSSGFSGIQVVLIVLLAILLTAGVTVWVIVSDVFATRFEPVVLDSQEQQVLQKKLHIIGIETDTPQVGQVKPRPLEAEAYSESDADRQVSFSEKELNALLANNTDLAEKLAIDLSGKLISAKLLLPLDEQMPILGGKTLKVTAGLGLSYSNGRPVVILKGVSVWGVPVPAAYLGNLKNVDIINEFGDQGFWKAFAEGLEDIDVREGELYIRFKP